MRFLATKRYLHTLTREGSQKKPKKAGEGLDFSTVFAKKSECFTEADAFNRIWFSLPTPEGVLVEMVHSCLTVSSKTVK